MALTASMIGSLAHELRNPLSAAKGLLQLSARKHQAERSATYNDLILRELDRVTQLLNEFLLMGKVENLNLEATKLDIFLSELFPLFEGEAAGTSIKIIKDFVAVPQVYFDQGQLTQVVLNLVRNAVDANGMDGKITLRLRSKENQVIFEVQDEGPGLSASDSERIFQPFFTTKEYGTGLGLAVSQSIVQSHGGEIYARNAEGGGAVFSVHIPAYYGQEPLNIDVMIITTDELLRYPIEKTLSKAGFVTLSSTTPEEAFLRCQSGPAVLILSTITDQLLLNVHQHWPHTKIVTVDSHNNVTQPGVHFFRKPVNYSELINVVRSLLM